MISGLTAGVRGVLVGAAIAGAFGLGSAIWSYQLGKAHERAAANAENFQAVVARVGEEADRLAGVAEVAEARLEADHAWRAAEAADFLNDWRGLVAAAGDLRRQFDANPDGRCPGSDDDVRLYNTAFGLTAAQPGAADPGG